ncbi:MAG: molybdenum cofactor guanylyltransferase [Myxococcota bacterium]|nr:molybdenum cofactor guanylyltransferase [Myxococcota bacterium]
MTWERAEPELLLGLLSSARVLELVCGIFVGGASRRMGRPKGHVCLDGEPLLVRAVRVAREASLDVVLVGDATPYDTLVPEVTRLADAPIPGPLGGLRALVELAPRVIVLAVDMPYVDADTLRALVDHPSDADVLLAKRERWEPLLSRWQSAPTREALDRLAGRGERSLRALVAASRAHVFELDPWRLDDWDRPEDVTSRPAR